ncbi:hypothetical protein SLS57_002660 [Botryosphaeria dothidea]
MVAASSSSKSVVITSQQCKSDPPAFQIVLPDNLTRSAYESKSLGLFWELYLPYGQNFTSAQGQFTTGSWLRIVDSIYHREDTLKQALLAMSLGIVGQRHGDTWMTQQGFATHGRALREMSRAVESPERSRRDELLAAARLMALFEIIFGANDQDKFAQARSWSSHVKGELLLLQARGPQAHTTGAAHHLFVDGRLNSIIAAIRARKRTVLSNPEWKEIPWLAIPKTPKDALLDIMVEIPTVTETLDRIETLQTPEEKYQLANKVLQMCWTLDMQLTEWVLNMNFVANLDLDNLGHVEETGDLAVGQLIYLYWVTCIMVTSTLRSANGARAEPQNLPVRIDPRLYARKIARSASYFFGPERGIWCAHASSFPIGIALSVLTDPTNQDENDRELIMSVFSQGEMGATIGKFLNSMRAGYNVSQCRLRGSTDHETGGKVFFGGQSK